MTKKHSRELYHLARQMNDLETRPPEILRKP
jgi:hypothetical protein